ncbi:MAG: type I secretion system permease/ATPase [Magnetovibrio sp.]|nr:type I secretion system permease/ATPase [Magnetovibrio sp.]
MKSYLNALRPHFLAVIMFSVVINALVMASPLYMLQLYDRVLSSRSVETLISLTAITTFLLLTMAALDLLRSKLLVRAGTVLHQRIADRLFDTVLKRTSSHPREPSREAQKDLYDLRQFISGTGLVALIDAPWVIIFLGAIFAMHSLLGMVALVGAVGLFALAMLAEFSTRDKIESSRKATQHAERCMSQSVNNADTLRVMGMVPDMSKIWRAGQDVAVSYQDTVSERLGSLASVSKAMRLLLQMAMLGTGAWLAAKQEITPGFMIAASIIMGRALAPVEQALGAWRGFSAARRGYQRLNMLFTVVPEADILMELPVPAAKLVVKGLFGGAPGSSVPILKNINLRLGPGTILGIVGPSASGKSTLARLLVGVWPAASGDVRLDGIDLGSLDGGSLGAHIGYLPQEVDLLEGTVKDNISRFSNALSDPTVKAAKLAGIHDMVLNFPNGYDTIIGPKGVVLSGGQKQRIGLARAFFGDPVLIVMDEPDSHLDDDSTRALVRALDTLKKEGRVIVVTTHRSTMMPVIDSVLALRDGQIEVVGPTKEVLLKLRGGAPPKPQINTASAEPVMVSQ